MHLPVAIICACVAAGRITEFKVGTPGHSISISCYNHSNCSVVRLAKQLPASSTQLCMNYLWAGRRLSRRDQRDEHIKMRRGGISGFQEVQIKINNSRGCLNHAGSSKTKAANGNMYYVLCMRDYVCMMYDVCMDGWIDGCMDGWKDGWMYGCMDVWMDGWMNYVWIMYGCMDYVWMYGWMYVWMYGCMDVCM